MSRVKISDVVFFFGAGASAPFGIPTMKGFVIDFEKSLNYSDRSSAQDEKETYNSIKDTLEKRLGRPVDLEAIFTVIDGILNYCPERLGLLSLYSATELKNPNEYVVTICEFLRERFQTFVRKKCEILEESFNKIGSVYHDFFNRFALELKADDLNTSGDYAWQRNWTIFTTNYDLCLEYYWREVARVGMDTGFRFDTVRHLNVLRSHKFLNETVGMQLFKLHGSVNWLVEKGTNEVIEEEMVKGRSHMGRRFAGEMMLYPIAEKELYVDPYISMLLRLNRELERKSVWVVIGYSFNDPIVREIFLRKSNGKKHLILVHPQANEVYFKRLDEYKGKKSLMNEKFGIEGKFPVVNYDIIRKLKDSPKYNWDKTPTP